MDNLCDGTLVTDNGQFFGKLIYIDDASFQITGDNIVHALQTQVVHYTIYTSLFDVVVSALLRFLFLILFYGLCHLNHWIVIAVSLTRLPILTITDR